MSRLHRAARLGQYDEVAECLAQGENVNAVSIHHFSALVLAAREGHLPIVLLLLKAGASVNFAHPNGRTPLHFAASQGHLEIVQALVANGANVNALSKAGCTPATEAGQFIRREVFAFLTEQGADTSLKDRQGMSADTWMAEGGIVGRFERQFPDWAEGSPRSREREEKDVRELMAQGLSADEYAAKHGRNILVWGYGDCELNDAQAEQWARRVKDILFTPGLLAECEEQHVRGEELEEARKRRARREKNEARNAKRTNNKQAASPNGQNGASREGNDEA